MQHAATAELLLQHPPVQAVGVAGALNDGTIRHGFAAHEECDADDPVVPYHRDLRRHAVFHEVEERHDGGGGKVYIPQFAAGFVDDLAEVELHRFKGCPHGLVFVRRQGCEQMVRQVALTGGHGRISNSSPIGCGPTAAAGKELAERKECSSTVDDSMCGREYRAGPSHRGCRLPADAVAA